MKQNDYDTIFASSSQFKSAIKIIRITGKKAKKIPKILNFIKPKPRIFSLKKLTYKNKVIDHAPVVGSQKITVLRGRYIWNLYTW